MIDPAPNRYESISIDRLKRYASSTDLDRAEDGDIHLDIDGSRQMIYRNPAPEGEPWEGSGEWTGYLADEIRDVLLSIMDDHCMMEIRMDNRYGESRILIGSETDLDPYEEVMPFGDRNIDLRRIERTGRRFLASFLNDDDPVFLGSIEMVRPPLSGWMRGGDPGPIEEGEIFITPSQTMPLDIRYRLIDESVSYLEGSDRGIHLFSWLLDNSMERTDVTPLGSGVGPESVILSASTGEDLFDLHWKSMILGVHDEGSIRPIGYSMDEWHPGVFMGTVPSSQNRDIIISGRSVEQTFSYLIQEGKDDHPGVDMISALIRDLTSADSLFHHIDRRMMDPFFIQKVYKLPKIEARIRSMRSDPDLSNPSSIHLLKTAIRRGFDPVEIASRIGVTAEKMKGHLKRPDLNPRLKYRDNRDRRGHTPLILSWPEVGAEEEWKPDLPTGGSDPGAGRVVSEIMGDGNNRILLTSDPALTLMSGYDGAVIFGPESDRLAASVLSSHSDIGHVQIYSVREK